MRNLFIIICSLCFAFGYSQKKYQYYIHLSDYTLAPTFTNVNGSLVYSGTNSTEASFFSGRNLSIFEPAFPDGIDISVKNIFLLETTSSTLATNMLATFPSLYLLSEDITDVTIEMLDYYPNDYGTTSPNPNFGFDFARIEWDYINVPKAWEISNAYGVNTIKIGISDNIIYGGDLDVIDKIEAVPGYSLPTYPIPLGIISHGTDVATTAAGRGDNNYGNVGVCKDCHIVSGINVIGNNALNYTLNNLYKMAKLGAKVVNCSWRLSGLGSYPNNIPDEVEYDGYVNDLSVQPITPQLVINEIVNSFRVTIVAASGNKPSWSTSNSFIEDPNPDKPPGTPWSPFNEIFVFPASYDNVISVGSIMQKSGGDISNDNMNYIPDSVSGFVDSNGLAVINSGINQNQWNPNGLVKRTFTLNHKVDILAPGWQTYSHSAFQTNPPTNFGWTAGTSFSAPTVSGTIGLMLSINDCLYPKEIESILKLTTKDVENMPLNQNFVGYVGAGKLEVGDAVEFTNEMKKIDGNAVIDNHIFNRFNYELKKFNNKLTISNATFKDNCTTTFEARNQIQLSNGTHFKPNTNGNAHLSINNTMDIGCTPIVFPKSNNNSTNSKNESKSTIILSPNPNNGIFKLLNINLKDFDNEQIQLQVLDLNGRNLYSRFLNENDITNCEVNLNNLSSGIYFVKLSSTNRKVDIKFIKN